MSGYGKECVSKMTNNVTWIPVDGTTTTTTTQFTVKIRTCFQPGLQDTVIHTTVALHVLFSALNRKLQFCILCFSAQATITGPKLTHYYELPVPVLFSVFVGVIRCLDKQTNVRWDVWTKNQAQAFFKTRRWWVGA